MNTAAIVLAAGAGTRMKSKKPKVAHEILGKPLVRWVVDAAREAGADRIVSVVGHAREIVEPLVSDTEVVVQKAQRGTADAVLTCKEALAGFDGSLLVLSGDCPLITPDTIRELADMRARSNAAVVVLTMELDDPFGYGRIIRDGEGRVERIVEQKDANAAEAAVTECNSGFYCFDAQALFEALEQVGCDNAQGEFYLTDALKEAKAFGKVGAFAAPDPLSVEGVNDRVQLAALAKAHNMRVCEHWMRAGVTILDPQTTWIEDDVRIEADAVILPGCFLQGNTSIGAEAQIGPYTTLIDATVDAQAHVERSRVQDTHIGRAATIGPWTYLRPGNEIGEEAKAGAFVEMKKAHIGRGTKVPHLSYVGDADLGEHTNIGGGTITANYDGVHKHHTTIGSGAHIGAGNLFVAPVTVGDHVTSGAGSVIRHEVPDDAMVYSENTQHNVEHWKPAWERETA